MGNVLSQVIDGLAASDSALATALQGSGYDSATAGGLIADWLKDGTRPTWFGDLPQGMKDALGEIEQKLTDEGLFGTGDAMQEKINEVLADYYDSRAKAIDDANDSIKGFKFVPMIKLGVMYRF